MPDDRPWYVEPESFVALAALIVSISAVAVGIYEAALQRRHDRAEVWPHLEIGTYTSPQTVAVKLENNGIGPAIVQSVIVTVDGKPMANWPQVVRTLIGHKTMLMSYESATQRGIRAGDNVTLVAVPTDSLPPGFGESVKRVSLSVCYTSVFNEAWQVHDDSLTVGSVWKPVDKCPAEPKNSDF